jgi:DNA-binding transcriptional LysR family regulator
LSAGFEKTMSEAALAGENGCGRTTHRGRRLRLSNFDLGIPPDTRKALDKILKEHGVVVQHIMEFDNVETVKRVVEIDAGISIVPESKVIQEIDTNLPADHFNSTVNIGASHHARKWMRSW